MFCQLHAFVNPNNRKAHPRIEGVRVYASKVFMNDEVLNRYSQLNFIGEVRFDKGIRGSGQSGYNIWQYPSDKTFTGYDALPWYYAHSDHIATLGTETFKTFQDASKIIDLIGRAPLASDFYIFFTYLI